MEKYKVLEHVSDIYLRIFGKDLEELFSNACFAVSDVMLKGKWPKDTEVKREIKIKSENLNGLLVDFLNELLFQRDVNSEVYKSLKVKKISENELSGELIGVPVEEIFLEIKAATYHNLKIEKNPEGHIAEIILDI